MAYDDNGIWQDDPSFIPDPGQTTAVNYNPYADQPGGGGVYSGLDQQDISYIQQTPGLMDWFKSLGLSGSDLGRLIQMAGGVYGLVAGIQSGNQNTQRMIESASQQAQLNLNAAGVSNKLSNPNMVTPLGSSTWSDQPDASGRYTRTDLMSPEQKALYDQQVGLGGRRNVLAGQALDQLGANLSKPFGLGGSVPMVDMSKMGQGIQMDPGDFGAIQKSLDYSGAPAMPIADEALRAKVTADVLAQHKPAFDAQWNEQIRATDTQLRGEGMGPETPAYKAQMKRIYDDMGTAWNELERGATAEGLSAMNTRFNENMASRQQGVGEINTQGGFANTAQQQNANQLLASMTARNTAQAQGTGQYLAGTAANQAGRGQAFNEYSMGYTMPAYLSSFLAEGGKPTMPTFPNPTPTTVGGAGATNVLGGNVGAGFGSQGNVGLTTDFLTRTAPSWFGVK